MLSFLQIYSKGAFMTFNYICVPLTISTWPQTLIWLSISKCKREISIKINSTRLAAY